MLQEAGINPVARAPARLKQRRLGIDTYEEAVLYMHRHCPICQSEGFEAQSAARSFVRPAHFRWHVQRPGVIAAD